MTHHHSQAAQTGAGSGSSHDSNLPAHLNVNLPAAPGTIERPSVRSQIARSLGHIVDATIDMVGRTSAEQHERGVRKQHTLRRLEQMGIGDELPSAGQGSGTAASDQNNPIALGAADSGHAVGHTMCKIIAISLDAGRRSHAPREGRVRGIETGHM